jgi:hypothetical protein
MCHPVMAFWGGIGLKTAATGESPQPAYCPILDDARNPGRTHSLDPESQKPIVQLRNRRVTGWSRPLFCLH